MNMIAEHVEQGPGETILHNTRHDVRVRTGGAE